MCSSDLLRGAAVPAALASAAASSSAELGEPVKAPDVVVAAGVVPAVGEVEGPELGGGDAEVSGHEGIRVVNR